jgi:predicted PurR-regulated permease PerM
VAKSSSIRAWSQPTAGAPAGLGRGLVLLLGAAATVVTAAGIRAGAEIVAPVMLGLVLTIAVLPLTRWAKGHGWPGWAGTLLALVAACAIVLVLLLGTVLAIAKLVELLPQYADDARSLRTDGTDFLTSHGIGSAPATTAVDQLDPAKLTSALTTVLKGVLGAAGNLFFLVTLLFFLCTAIPLAGPRFATLRVAKPELAGSLGNFIAATQRYLVVTALFGAIVAVLDTGALWLMAVPLPVVWGLFSFITNFIPNIGFVVGVIPPALLALLDGGWDKALLVVVVYSGLNVVIQTFIQPRYVGATVGLSAEMTFLSLVVWTFLLGPLGALLAVPMTLLVRALLIDPDSRVAWVSPLISTTVDPPDDGVGPAAPAPGPATDPAPAPA